MHAFYKIAESIAGNVPAVLERFDSVTEQDPWTHLPGDYRVNYLGEVIAMASRLALSAPDDAELCRELLRGAAHHGHTRLEHGLSDSIIFREVYLVRESIWGYIQENYPDEGETAAEAIIRIDAALSLASKASLRGYYRAAFEARGTWPQVIEQMTSEWNVPPALPERVEMADA